MSDRVARIAEKLAADWDARAGYESLTGELAPADLAEAYRAQAALQEKLAERRGPVAGRKIALSSKPLQEMVGISQPVAGMFFARDIRWSPATVPLAEFRRLGLEFELAFEMAADVPPQAAPHDRDSVRALIAGVRPAYELIEDRGADYSALDAFTLVCRQRLVRRRRAWRADPGLAGAGPARAAGDHPPAGAGGRALRHRRGGAAGLAGLGAEPRLGGRADGRPRRARHHRLGDADAVPGRRATGCATSWTGWRLSRSRWSEASASAAVPSVNQGKRAVRPGGAERPGQSTVVAEWPPFTVPARARSARAAAGGRPGARSARGRLRCRRGGADSGGRSACRRAVSAGRPRGWWCRCRASPALPRDSRRGAACRAGSRPSACRGPGGGGPPRRARQSCQPRRRHRGRAT